MYALLGFLSNYSRSYTGISRRRIVYYFKIQYLVWPFDDHRHFPRKTTETIREKF